MYRQVRQGVPLELPVRVILDTAIEVSPVILVDGIDVDTENLHVVLGDFLCSVEWFVKYSKVGVDNGVGTGGILTK